MIFSKRVRAGAVTFAVCVAVIVGSGKTAYAYEPAGPPSTSFTVAVTYSLLQPDANPPGANDWSCRPTPLRPRPIILVHGTGENRYNNWARMAPDLKADGFCVFALNYGDPDNAPIGVHPAVKGYGDIRQSARELGVFVDRVRTATGSSQVDIVGHSQGGLMPRQYLTFEGGADPANPSRNKVHGLVTLGAPHHGTTVSGIATMLDQLGLIGLLPPITGPASTQQTRDSEFIRTLNQAGDTLPGITYTVIATQYDQASTPYDATFLTAGPGATVHNITLQAGCGLDLSDHFSMSYSPRAVAHVRNALDPGPDTTPPCTPHLPAF